MNDFRKVDVRWAEKYALNWSWNLFFHGLCNLGWRNETESALYAFQVDGEDYVILITRSWGGVDSATLPFGDSLGFAYGSVFDGKSRFQCFNAGGSLEGNMRMIIEALRVGYEDKRSAYLALGYHTEDIPMEDKLKLFKKAATNAFVRFENWFDKEEIPYNI